MPPFIFPKVPEVDTAQKLLVVPIVSTANIGQLAVDILIPSHSLEHLAVLDAQHFVPVVGARDDGKDGITTPYELYGSKDLDFMVIQQRSPVLKSKKDQFVSSLLTWIKEAKFRSVVFISGVETTNRTDDQLLTPVLQLVPPNSPPLPPAIKATLEKMGIQTYTSPVSQFPVDFKAEANSSVPFIPGGGLTRRILSSLPEDWDIPVLSVLQFVSEGDNGGDARMLAAITSMAIGHERTQWKVPASWKHGLFGAPHDQSLYG